MQAQGLSQGVTPTQAQGYGQTGSLLGLAGFLHGAGVGVQCNSGREHAGGEG